MQWTKANTKSAECPHTRAQTHRDIQSLHVPSSGRSVHDRYAA
jgi:hypothetical protein